MKAGILILVLIFSENIVASEFYKCVDAAGKKIFSDTPCSANSVVKETIIYKASSGKNVPANEVSWDVRLRAQVPGKSKINDIVKENDDSIINYQFSSQVELQEFMRLAVRLSGKNVNLIRVNMPQGETPGTAMLQVTDKDDGPLNLKPKS